jgi:hypothetical protein
MWFRPKTTVPEEEPMKTNHSPQNPSQALQRVVGQIQRAKRKIVASEIEILAKLVGCDEDLFVDRRTLRKSKPEDLTIKATWRSGGEVLLTLADAAKMVGRSTVSLGKTLGPGRNKPYYYEQDGDVITITRV